MMVEKEKRMQNRKDDIQKRSLAAQIAGQSEAINFEISDAALNKPMK